MSARIIQFDEARSKIIAKRTSLKIDFNKKSMTGTASQINQSAESYKKIRRIIFNQEYKKLIDSFHTAKTEFMFPTILSGYRHGINPVDALYNNLQEALFRYDKRNQFCVWIVDLFKDFEWTDKLCAVLERDQNIILQFQEAMFDPHFGVGDKEIIELERIRNKFAHYAEVFKLMKSWKEH